MAKKAYRVCNWAQYNKALINRGSVTFWFHEKTIAHWYVNKPRKKEGQGRPFTYSEMAIETCAILRLLYHLPLRACQGFVESLCQLVKLAVRVPSYTQLCRRQKTLNLQLSHQVRGPIHVVVDGTGLKMYGEGEWKVRQHGYSKHRMWRKLHIGIDVKSKEIVMRELTDNHIGENKLFDTLLDHYPDGYTHIGGDKAYDSFTCHESIGKRGARSAVLPQKKAKIRKYLHEPGATLVRDNVVRRIREVGKKGWKQEVGYHQRSLVENTMFRYKTVFGSKLKAHSMSNQKIEALICSNILNNFTQRGMPISIVK